MILIIQLLLAHLIGDFLLQPAAWVEHKQKNKIRSVFLWVHAAIHFGLIILLVQDAGFWPYALLISILHLAIDLAKLYGQSHSVSTSSRRWFFYDQVLHLVTLLVFWWIYTSPEIYYGWLKDEDILLTITAFVFITKPASVIIKMFITKWDPYAADESQANVSATAMPTPAVNSVKSLSNAGQWIGYIERILTVVMVINNQWEAVGFFIAAKSVFRIGDVREANDRKMTEYILIGTLLSFGIAILTGLIVK